MSKVKTSTKGITYVKPKILKKKQKVFSQAILMKIPHNHDENDISLKIGRYNFIDDSLTTNNPKSELTLDNDELNELINYISSCYTPVCLGKGDYINIEGKNAELIRQFKILLESQENTANLLIENDILTDNVYTAASSIKKKKALKSFEEALKCDFLEPYWQKWFTENKWILGSDFVQIITTRQIDTDNIADYIMKAFDSFIDLVEIKKPNSTPFWATTKDHKNYIPSTDLIKAITQCLNYIHAIELEANSIKFHQKTKSKVIKPRCILIFGRSNDWNDEQKESYRILNAAYNQVSILTYDHLLARAKNVLGIEDNNDNNEFDGIPF